jgi:hypothetical protein
MRRSTLIFLLVCGCSGSPPGTGTLYARISSDPALAKPFTTEDGWTLSFSHLVVAVSSFSASGGGTTAFPTPLGSVQLIDFSQDTKTDLASNMSADPKSYDHISIAFSRGGTDKNVDVPTDVLERFGQRAFYIEGSATKGTTTSKQFRLGLGSSLTYDNCMPVLTLEASSSQTLSFMVHAQHVFDDDQGKMRFDAFGAADASPLDGIVETTEAAAVMTSSLLPAQYGATMGSLVNVLQKRALTVVGVGDSGTCAGH